VQHAERAVDRAAVARETLHAVGEPLPPLPAIHVGAGGVAYGVVSVLLALAVAWLGLFRRRAPAALRRVASRVAGPPFRRLILLHDGVVGEYVTWAIVGAATLGVLVAALAR
jgi:multicomponent Na+:H+ antiporter subunit D